MSGPDEETKRQRDEAFWERVRRAREMTAGEKLMAGPRMFDEWSAQVRADIRAQNPELSDEQVREKFRKLLAEQKRIDEAGFYCDAG